MNRQLLMGLVAMSFAATSVLTTACDSENALDVTNPEQTALNESWAEKFGEIDATQDWTLADTAKATISVAGLDGLANYKLQLYTDNPITSSAALLMATKQVTTDAAGAASATFIVDIVKGHTVYYAGYVDKDNRRSVKPVALINGVIDAQFGTASASGAKVASRASANADNVDIPSVSDPSSEVNAKYSQAKEVSSNNADQNWDGSADYATVLKITGSWNGNISVLASTNQAARTLYVDGTWTLNGAQSLGGTSDASQYAGGLIVVRNGGKIVIPSGSSLSSNNGARIVVLSGGTIEGDGSITFCNGSNNSFDYNAGTINIGTMNNNGGDVYNYGTMTIGDLQGGAGSSRYINHSNTMTVNNCVYNSQTANAQILTDCKLEVTNNLCCRNIMMGNPSYIHVGGNLLMSASNDGSSNSSEILMDANAQLSVDGGVALNNTSIVGPTTGWAVCEFGQIGDPTGTVATNYTTSWATGAEQVTEGYVINNLYISIDQTETIDNYYSLSPYGKFTAVMMNGRLYDVASDQAHNWQGYPSYRANAQAGNGNAVMVTKGEANVSIPSDGCVKGYSSSKGTSVEPDPQGFIIACEDLGSTNDVDYNDVVFCVSHAQGSTTMTVTPLAAGGTLAARINYDGQDLGEIHSLLGNTDTKKMINTSSQKITAVGTPVLVTVPSDWDFSSNYKKFTIEVTSNEGKSQFVTAPKQGTAPFMIVVPGTWQWPLEKVNIEDSYPNFKNWSQDAATNDQWISSRVAAKTISR